jgi:tetratricopeptide (TPR) repeat protein
MKRKLLLMLLLTAAVLGAVAAVLLLRHPAPPPAAVTAPSVPRATAASYVGAETCQGCHAREYQQWWGSHHQLAMQEATGATVLGDFHDARFTRFQVTSRFFRRDGRFLVNTDGPDGHLQDYEIRYTFGVYPLQQYLVAFPDGRLQALPLAWDSRPKDHGGQKWFHLYPKENLPAGDELHWTNLQQNWNFMCAECHSTDLRKNYDAAHNTFRTTWKDINVACEACHGAASVHVRWAQRPSPAGAAGASGDDGLLAHFDDRRGVSWIMDAATGNSHRSRPRANTDELEMCGRCHARAAKISEDWVPGKPLLDTHQVALLDEGLYSADGQMQAEVYNYGSFLQSKMFAAGVTCSDCHDPHTQRLRTTDQQVCGLCHSLSRYDSASHHHHKEQSAESRCPACHMPQRTYMVVDPRHDHSFRIPRPDDSVRYGTPNACNDCHRDKTAAWAAHATENWYGSQAHSGYQHFTGAIVAGRRQSSTAGTDLLSLAGDDTSPAIARATALSELGAYLDSNALGVARQALQSPDAMMRLAAVQLLAGADPAMRWEVLAPSLHDAVRAVRSAAASELAGALPGDLTAETRRAFEQALAEFVATQQLNADRPEAHLSLGNLYAAEGNAEEAQAQFQQAIKLWPDFIPAYVNLADLSRARKREDEAERCLTQGLKVSPDNPQLLYALGLLRVRQHHPDEALSALARAAQRAPQNARYAYVYGVGLYSTGKRAQGLAVLRQAHDRFPGNREVLLGLASLTLEAGDAAAAERYAEAFVAIAPADPQGRQLLEQLKAGGRPQ